MVLVAALVTVFGVTSVGVSENAGAAQTTCPSAIGLSNGDFENPTVPAGAGNNILDSNAAAIWKTTATDHNIEYWRNGGSSTSNNGNLAITAESGSQWVELNATQASTLYQDLTTVPGQVMRWSLWHRARYTGTANGQDVMAVKIGTTTTQVQQGSNISDGPNAWVNYTGSYTVPAGQTTTRFAFTAVSTSSGNATIGNFLDNVQFSNAPCLTTSKTVTDLTASSGGLTRPGDTLQYTVTVNNTGGAMSSNDVVTDAIPANTTYVPGSLVVSGAAVTDATDTDVGQFSGGTVTGRVGTGATSTTGGTIAAGGTTTMTFKVTVNAGTAAGTVISNTANTTYQWAPAATTYTSTTNTLTNTVATTGITVAKSVSGTTDVNGDGKLNTGDKVAYTFLVTNTGSTALTAVGVNDSKATVSCPSSTLASGASETCTATYTVTQADVDSGSVVNTATATGTPPSGASAITSAPSTATKALDQTAALTLTKSGASADTNGDGKLDVGDKITYSYLVKNTGSVTLNPVSINDTHSGLSAITCPTTSLAALATTTCTATYPITQADLDAGVANNTATASGKPPTGASVTSAPSTAAVTLPPAPALTVTKSATSTPTTLTAAGQTVAYSFLVKNTGNVTVTGIAVSDTFTAPAGPVPTINCPVTTLGSRRLHDLHRRQLRRDPGRCRQRQDRQQRHRVRQVAGRSDGHVGRLGRHRDDCARTRDDPAEDRRLGDRHQRRRRPGRRRQGELDVQGHQHRQRHPEHRRGVRRQGRGGDLLADDAGPRGLGDLHGRGLHDLAGRGRRRTGDQHGHVQRQDARGCRRDLAQLLDLDRPDRQPQGHHHQVGRGHRRERATARPTSATRSSGRSWSRTPATSR